MSGTGFLHLWGGGATEYELHLWAYEVTSKILTRRWGNDRIKHNVIGYLFED